MKIFKEVFRRPVTVLFSIILMIGLGIYCAFGMSINLLPDISFPYLSVQTVYVGADAETVDEKITLPMEAALNRISGIRDISTYSIDNASIVVMQFEYGTNLDAKKDEVNEILNEVTLPEEAKNPTISDLDLNATSIFTMMLYSEEENMEILDSHANALNLKMQSIAGVSKTTLTGDASSAIHVDMIHGLEPFAALIVQELSQNYGYDIPLGEIASDTGSISVTNHSGAKTIEELQNTMVGVTLSDSYIQTFKSFQEMITHIEEMNTDELESLHQDAIDMNRFMDEIDAKKTEELPDFCDDVTTMKSIITLLNQYSSASLKMMWNSTLKDIVEDEDFKNLSEDELRDISEDTGISYSMLKWLQDNSEVNPATGKTYAEEKWDILVEFRKEHPDEIEDEAYPALFYDLEIYSPELEQENYKSEPDIIDEVRACKVLSIYGLDHYREKRENDETIENADYAMLFATATTKYSIPMSATTIQIIKSPNFESNYQIFYAYKEKHQHEEIKELEDGTTETIIVGDAIPSGDFMRLYSDMTFEEPFQVEPTAQLIDFVRDVDFKENRVKFLLKQSCNVAIQSTYASRAYYNGKEAIQIDLYGGSGSNATQISKDAQEIIESYNAENPSITVVMLNNQADFINDSLSNAVVSLLIGMVLAVLVIYLFLRKVKSSLIIALSMPLSVLCTLVCLHFMGITLNMVSVGGLAVGIGMLVDNSIVVLESITKERESGKDVYQASVDGVKLVLGSLIGSTLTSICVFFPILCINGLTKEIFADLAWAVIFSLSFSLLVSIFVIPTLFCLFYKKENKEEKEKKTVFPKIVDWYGRALKKALYHKWIVIASAMLIFLSSFLLIFACKIEFLPSIDQRKIEITIPFEAGTKDEECQRVTYQAYDILCRKADYVDSVSMSVGYTGMIQTSQSGTIYLEMEESNIPTKTHVDTLRNLLHEEGFERDFSVAEIDGVVATLVGGMSGVSTTIYGEDIDTLKCIAEQVEAKVMTYDAVKRASDNMLTTSQSYTVVFDQDKLVDQGIDYTQAVSTLRVGLAGYSVASMDISDKEYEVIVGWDDEAIDYYGELKDVILGVNGDNEFVTLEMVSEIQKTEGRHIIRKSNGLNILSISIETYGIDTNTASRYLKNSVEDVLKAYPEYKAESSGVSYYLTDAFSGLVVALIISFFLLFGVMACLFESLRKPCIIIFSFPFAFTGGFIALACTRVGISVVSFIGLIMLMGVIINDAIVLNERIDQLIEAGYSKQDGVIQGCKERLRAVLMTTLTTVLALIPMALGIGKGAELMQPLGIVAIGGMTLGTCVTLILIPSVYCVVYHIRFKKEENSQNEE